MTTHKTATREEWLKARIELLQAEKELTHRSDEVARRRQDLPWVPINKGYRFETEEGGASLADLFRGRSQLLVYHFMFGAPHSRTSSGAVRSFLSITSCSAPTTRRAVPPARLSPMGSMALRLT